MSGSRVRRILSNRTVRRCGLFSLVIFACLTAYHFTLAQPIYREWIADYGQPLGKGAFYSPDGERIGESILLRVTAITGDDPIPDDLTDLERWNLTRRKASGGHEVSITGKVRYFSASSRGFKGSSGNNLTPEELKELKAQLATLPDNHQRIPPAGRRMVVQSMLGGELEVRVYDRAAMPDQVLEILRLSHANLRSHVLSFEPTREWTAYEGHDPAVISVLPDGRLFTASEYHSDWIKIWNPATGEMLQTSELPKDVLSPGIELARQQVVPMLEAVHVFQLIPDTENPWAVIVSEGELRLIETRHWKTLRTPENPLISTRFDRHSLSRFLSDGKEFLYQDGKIPPRIYETDMWTLIDSSDRLPKGLLYSIPAEAGSPAIYAFDDNSIELWDVEKARSLATLDEKARLGHAAFSPDGSLVAVATKHPKQGDYWGVYRIRVWAVRSGELLHEYRPFEQDRCESVESLLWSQDGQYLLAMTKSDSFFTSRAVSVWNVADGRHRGELTGCPTTTTGTVWLADGRLVAGCNDGKIRIWDAKAAFREIEAFEATLPKSE